MMEKLSVDICHNCICLPRCLVKANYYVITECQLIQNAIWDLVSEDHLRYELDNFQIYLDLIDIYGLNRQVILEKQLNKNGAYRVYVRVNTIDFPVRRDEGETTFRVRISKILKSEVVNEQ